MSPLPRISGRKAVAAFGQFGYVIDRQRGSHIVLRCEHPPFRRLVVPDHKELSRGTLRALVRQAGLTVDQFASVL